MIHISKFKPGTVEKNSSSTTCLPPGTKTTPLRKSSQDIIQSSPLVIEDNVVSFEQL